jgi:uncharacterized membrane protein HdeD (DUF308 family)
MDAIPVSRPHAFPTEVHALADRWWAVLLRGIFAVLFGALAILVPGVTLAVLILLFGAYAVVDGIFNLVAAFRGESGDRWWELALEGIVSLGAGIVAWVMPGLTAVVFVVLVGIWAIITGVLEIVAAVRLRREIKGEWLLALGGVASVVFGGFVLAYPGLGALALVLWIGAYAIVFGVILIALAFRLRGWRAESLPAQARRAA